MNTETLEFQAEARQLLPLNASDTLGEWRLAGLTDDSLGAVDLHDYTDGRKLREIVERYSDLISFPVTLGDETLNSMKALWARPRSEVGDEEYREFYQHLSHDWTARPSPLRQGPHIASFVSTAGDDPTTLTDCVARMKDGQDKICFLTGESRAQVGTPPHGSVEGQGLRGSGAQRSSGPAPARRR
jgi:HSP90 family molecular chaperone